MRISVIFRCVSSQNLILPIHYNRLVQSFIYGMLDRHLAGFYHDRGFEYGKRHFKLFTFSRLLAPKRKILKRSGEIVLGGLVCLKLGAVDEGFLESFVLNLVRTGNFRLVRNVCELESIKVEEPVRPGGPLIVKAISPITTYSTLETDGSTKKRLRYYTPFEEHFFQKLMENLMRKATAYYGEAASLPPLNNGYIKPVRVSERDKVVVNFLVGRERKNWIEGWLGTYELHLPDPYFKIAYHAGLGSKNSQGFGMVEVVEE